MKQHYWTRVGNTEVRIEVRNYDGVCDHCGMTRIKYLAHVRQHLADTLNRVYSGTLSRDEDQVAELAAHVIDGNTVKKVSVGCVCVVKYLVDCGVDAGLAKRLQKRVNTITNLLKSVAKVESLNTPEGIAQAVRDWEHVLSLREQTQQFYTKNDPRLELFPNFSPEQMAEARTLRGVWLKTWRDEYSKMVNEASRVEKSARTKYFSFYSYRPATPDMVAEHFDRVAKRLRRSLDIYTKIGEYE